MTSKQSKARVLYCESCKDGTVGGSHHCLLHLVEGLDPTQFEPVVVFYEENALIGEFRAVAETTVVDRIPKPVMWRIGRGSAWGPIALLRRVINMLKFIQAVLQLTMLLRRRCVDLVHLNNSITRNHEWMCAALLAGIPCVVSERGMNATYSWVERVLASRMVLVMPVSRWIMNHMVQQGLVPDNIRVFYDGIDPSARKVERSVEVLKKEYDVSSDQPVIGVVGNIREWKGQEVVVRAMIEVVRQRPEVVCFVVGKATVADQPYMDRLTALINEAGIQHNMRFTGYQSDPASFMNLMNIVIHSSILPEPYGMVVLEAMAQGKLVIGARAGGVIELVKDGVTGYMYPPGDAQSLAAYILKVLAAPDLVRKMGEAGYQRAVAYFSQRRYMAEIQAVYSAALSKKPIPSHLGIPASR